MQVYSDAPSRRRVTYKLRLERLRAHARARRCTCEGCHQRRLCAQVDPLAGHAAWFCLADCWTYHLGFLHGERAAADSVRRMVIRELDRVFDPGAVEAAGWPWYRCDNCGVYAPHPISEHQLLHELGWRHLGRDAHLCPDCHRALPRTGDVQRSTGEKIPHVAGPTGLAT